jgi:Ice-binding-like
MSMHSIARRIALGFSQAHRAAGVVVAAALVTAACGDGAPAVTSPLLNRHMASASAAPSSFALLANQAVTCTDGNITGNVGTYQAPPTGSVTRTRCPITGTIDKGNAFAQAAYEAFVARYVALTPALGECTTTNTITGTLAGKTLAPGTYCVSAEAKTGVLTLTGSGPWTFKVLGALTGTNFTVLLEDPSKACDVTWWVEAASTMTDSHFVGTILAGAGITLTRGTFDGNAYSQADVTVTGADVAGCAAGTGGTLRGKCNQGVGNGPEGCDPGNSNHNQPSNDENGGTKGNPGRKP